MNSLIWPASSVWVFIAQLVELCSANAEATASNLVEAPKNLFLGYFRNCLNCDSLRRSHIHFICIPAVHIISFCTAKLVPVIHKLPFITFSIVPSTPGSLLDQLLPGQQHETADLEDHGFTDDSSHGNETLEKKSSVLESPDKNASDVGLCQAIEKTFLDLTKIAVVKQQNCES